MSIWGMERQSQASETIAEKYNKLYEENLKLKEENLALTRIIKEKQNEPKN